jgi:hypothetical protein
LQGAAPRHTHFPGTDEGADGDDDMVILAEDPFPKEKIIVNLLDDDEAEGKAPCAVKKCPNPV